LQDLEETSLSNQQDNLSIMYDNKQFATLASIVAAAGICSARDYCGGNLNKQNNLLRKEIRCFR
jgi:hypothetical protein